MQSSNDLSLDDGSTCNILHWMESLRWYLQVVLTSTNLSEICVNGMSFSRRASKWANAALVVTVSMKDFGALNLHGPLAGVEFQVSFLLFSLSHYYYCCYPTPTPPLAVVISVCNLKISCRAFLSFLWPYEAKSFEWVCPYFIFSFGSIQPGCISIIFCCDWYLLHAH